MGMEPITPKTCWGADRHVELILRTKVISKATMPASGPCPLHILRHPDQRPAWTHDPILQPLRPVRPLDSLPRAMQVTDSTSPYGNHCLIGTRDVLRLCDPTATRGQGDDGKAQAGA